tara:strand:- start:1481 stop:2776 length:1296 start_codon:yes stop_codon:yes gene_type:complete
MKYVNQKRILFVIIVISLILRISFIYTNRNAWGNEFGWGPDEKRNYEIASNYLKGFGYSIKNESGQYITTAFHSSFPVFIYKYLITSGIQIEYWTLFIQFLSTILYAFSIISFYRIINFFTHSWKRSIFGSSVYAFYPSIIYYIGSLFLYENIVLPILVILANRLLEILKNRTISLTEIGFISLMVTISILIRPQVVPIYFGLFLTFGFTILSDNLGNYHNIMKRGIVLIVFMPLVIFLAHIPILKINYSMFGHYIISTQVGFSLLEGHNPYARGSWSSEGLADKYAFMMIPKITEMNEYEGSQARKKIALNWIVNNPLAEVILLLRKMAIIFLPKNYSIGKNILPYSDIFNPINFFVHFLFLLSVFLMCLRIRELELPELIVLSPVVFSILLSLVFFVGYRWRLWAEPFMITYIFIVSNKFGYFHDGQRN